MIHEYLERFLLLFGTPNIYWAALQNVENQEKHSSFTNSFTEYVLKFTRYSSRMYLCMPFVMFLNLSTDSTKNISVSFFCAAVPRFIIIPTVTIVGPNVKVYNHVQRHGVRV